MILLYKYTTLLPPEKYNLSFASSCSTFFLGQIFLGSGNQKLLALFFLQKLLRVKVKHTFKLLRLITKECNCLHLNSDECLCVYLYVYTHMQINLHNFL